MPQPLSSSPLMFKWHPPPRGLEMSVVTHPNLNRRLAAVHRGALRTAAEVVVPIRCPDRHGAQTAVAIEIAGSAIPAIPTRQYSGKGAAQRHKAASAPRVPCDSSLRS